MTEKQIDALLDRVEALAKENSTKMCMEVRKQDDPYSFKREYLRAIGTNRLKDVLLQARNEYINQIQEDLGNENFQDEIDM